MTKEIHELRESEFHQEIGRKMCAASIPQQQRIGLNTVLKKPRRLLVILWLLLAELAPRNLAENADVEVPGERAYSNVIQVHRIESREIS